MTVQTDYRELQFTLKIPADLARFEFPPALNYRLQELLDRQDQGVSLTQAERQEAESLVELAELLSLIKLRTQFHELHSC
jgi:hypothetical protein